MLALLLSWGLTANAQQGKNGNGNITAANTVVNAYTSLTADATTGSTNITVANNGLTSAVLASPLAMGDLVMIIQMQGASINTNPTDPNYGTVTAYNSAGKYEVLQVASVSGSTGISFYCGLTNSYTATGKVQVVRMPRFVSLNIASGASITAPAWSGTTGGLVALEVIGATTNATTIGTNASITVAGKGFRGGAATTAPGPLSAGASYANAASTYGGQKGEGIAGFLNSYGRGPAANGGGGGNAYQAGGGGGANVGTGTYTGLGNPDRGGSNAYDAAWNLETPGFATATSPGGGRGGYSNSTLNSDALTQGPGSAAWGGDSRQNIGGLGGRPLDVSDNRLFLGGGGGGGSTAGGAGGGIIYVLTNHNISGTHEPTSLLLADGSAGVSSSAPGAAPGGGGGGGSILLTFPSDAYGYGFTASALGGAGGSSTATDATAGGPGGGGGGGYISFASPYINGYVTLLATAGSNGTTSSSSLIEFPPNGATKGGNGSASTAEYAGQCTTNADVSTELGGPTLAPVGSTVSYLITSTNTGPETASGVVQQLQLLPNLTTVSVSNHGTYNPLTGIATIPGRDIANQGSITGLIRLTLEGSISPLATSIAGSFDADVSNNDGSLSNAMVKTEVTQEADVAITVNGPSAVGAGDEVTYSILLTNNGPSQATGVTAQLALGGSPANVVVVGGGSYSGGTATFTVPNSGVIASGESVTYLVRFMAPATGSVTGVVSATSTTDDGDPATTDGDLNAANNDGTAVASQVTTTTISATPTSSQQQCAQPGSAGDLTFDATSAGINTYYPGLNSPAAGSNGWTPARSNTIQLGPAMSAGAPPLANGDLVLIMQMQGAQFSNANSDAYGDGVAGGRGSGYLPSGLKAGQYEYGIVFTYNSGSGELILNAPLVNSYTTARPTVSGTTASGRQCFQVIRIPQFQNLTLTSNLTNTPAWNGRAGGVLALDVAGQLNFGTNRVIDVSGKGFRGGGGRQLVGSSTGMNTDYRTPAPTSSATPTTVIPNGFSAAKGEGIAGTPRWLNANGMLVDSLVEGYPGGSMGRGAPGNAGAGGTDSEVITNQENTGGGGGSNGGIGGGGGDGWRSNLPYGGGGGVLFNEATPRRLIMGGGGGAGTNNNGTGLPANGFASSGAAGGGIVLIRATTVAGTGTINVSGADMTYVPDNDGSGGGGGGGSVLLLSNNSLAGVTVLARGGKGGSNTGNGQPHGPGGGGSGGLAFTSSALHAASSFSGGSNGLTFGSVPFGSEPGTSSASSSRTNVVLSETPLVIAASNCVADVTTTLAGPSQVQAGVASGTFTVTFANQGLGVGATITRRVTLPNQATLNSEQETLITSQGGTYTPPANASIPGYITFPTLASAPNGSSSVFTFRYTSPVATGAQTVASATTTATNQGSNVAPDNAQLRPTAVSTPLPVELLRFTVKGQRQTDALLTWHTASERNSHYWDIERSFNGLDFSKIAAVPGQGNKTSPTAYEHLDAGVAAKSSGPMYYRLRQVDQDGTTHFSPTQVVAFSQTVVPAISVYPNPSLGASTLDLSLLPADAYQLRMVDATGREVRRQVLPASGLYPLDLHELPQGLYLIRVRSATGNSAINLTQRLLKQ